MWHCYVCMTTITNFYESCFIRIANGRPMHMYSYLYLYTRNLCHLWKTVGESKRTEELSSLFAEHPTLGRSSSMKPKCDRTETGLICCSAQRQSVRTKTKMLEHPRSSPRIASCPARSRPGEHLSYLERVITVVIICAAVQKSAVRYINWPDI